jgi:uncharacterized membrane protein YwaF
LSAIFLAMAPLESLRARRAKAGRRTVYLFVLVLTVFQVLRYLIDRRLACNFIRPAVFNKSTSIFFAIRCNMRSDRVASLSARRLIGSSR